MPAYKCQQVYVFTYDTHVRFTVNDENDDDDDRNHEEDIFPVSFISVQ